MFLFPSTTGEMWKWVRSFMPGSEAEAEAEAPPLPATPEKTEPWIRPTSAAVFRTGRRLSLDDFERVAYRASVQAVTEGTVRDSVKTEHWWARMSVDNKPLYRFLLEVCKYYLAPQALGRGDESTGRALTRRGLEGLVEVSF